MKEKLALRFPWLRLLRAFNPARYTPSQSADTLRPVFIVGAGRSGSTLLRRILTTHPDFDILPELYVLGPVIQAFRSYAFMPWSRLVDMVVGRFITHPEFETFGIDMVNACKKIRELPPSKQTLADILDVLYSEHGERNGKRGVRWGDKTQKNVFYVDEIRKTFPRAQFIHILRDGYDVAASYLRTGLITEVEEAARRWVQATQIARRFMKQHLCQCYECRYEKLVTEPEDEVQNICRFLGVEFDRSMLEATNAPSELDDVDKYKHHADVRKKINAAAVGKGRDELSSGQIHVINAVAGKQIQELGYSVLAPDMGGQY